MMRGMVININDNGLHTVVWLRAFLGGTTAVSFSVANHERYDFIARTVLRFGYYISAVDCVTQYEAVANCPSRAPAR